MAKIGEDLYLSPQDDGLALRTINSSRSAFVSFLFHPTFFNRFEREQNDQDSSESDSQNESTNCKITMKVSKKDLSHIEVNWLVFFPSLFRQYKCTQISSSCISIIDYSIRL